MFDEKRFRAAIALSGKTMLEIAKDMGISVPTLYRKMSGESDFFRDEIQKFKCSTGTNNIDEIFFADKVS